MVTLMLFGQLILERITTAFVKMQVMQLANKSLRTMLTHSYNFCNQALATKHDNSGQLDMPACVGVQCDDISFQAPSDELFLWQQNASFI